MCSLSVLQIETPRGTSGRKPHGVRQEGINRIKMEQKKRFTVCGSPITEDALVSKLDFRFGSRPHYFKGRS